MTAMLMDSDQINFGELPPEIDWRQWLPKAELPEGAGRFALYTLKALAFIHLRKDERLQAHSILAALRRLDPTGAVGWPVVAALADGLR